MRRKSEKFLKKTFELAQKAQTEVLSTTLLQSEVNYLQKKLTQKKLKSQALNSELAYDLDLPGNVKLKYSRNGCHLLLFNQTSLSSFNSKSFDLHFEVEADLINDATYLHNELYTAVAQKNNVFIYNENGVELHSIREQCNKMEFLPYHFLLARIGDDPFLKYQDTSTGRMVSSVYIAEKGTKKMCQNSDNAIIHIGNSNGTVTLWSPTCKGPLLKVLCHSSRVLQVKVRNNVMATLGLDKKLNLWDCRNLFKPLGTIKLKNNSNQLDISQTNLIALGFRNKVTIFKIENFKNEMMESDLVYLDHTFHSTQITDMGFWPYEDILSVGYVGGFSNMIVPGAGSPNFDAFEESPYQSKKERQEREVKMLIEKIPPELITLDEPFSIEEDEVKIKEKPEKDKKAPIKNALSRFWEGK